jgi:hypothetical protein
MFIGPGAISMRTDADTEVSGFGGSFGIAAGAAVTDNLVIYGELFDDIATSPTFSMGGQEFEADDTSAGVVAVGAGVAYYVMPLNLYFSGTLAASQLTVQVDGEEVGESDWGLGASLMVGKEWWVSHDWGLGLAGQFYAGQMKDKDDGPKWNTTAGALVFSATYN